MKKIAFLLVVLAFGFGCGESGPVDTGVVTGLVVNTAYAPIPGATVTVAGLTSTTGSNGTYNISSVTSGLQTLSVAASGYITISKQITVSALDPTNVPIIVMSLKDSKSTEIGAGGGEVTSTDGAVKLTIPAGALKAATSISVAHPDLLTAPLAAPAGYRLIYLVYITPEDTALDSNATLTIPLPAEAASASSVPFFRFEASTLSWVAVSSGSVSTSTNTISVSIGKFGWYAAAIPVSQGSISGKVVNSSGIALAGASVWVSSNTTVTDPAGNYMLSNVPSGATTVYANSSGYSTNSVSVTVAAGALAYASNIILTSTSSIYGTITGKVTKASDGSAVSGAKVSASGKETYTDSSGTYLLSDINPGTIGVAVNAYGFASNSDNVSVTAGLTTSKDFVMTAISVTSFSDDFETDKSWTYESPWHRVQNSISIKNTLAPAYVTLPDYSTTGGAIPSAHGGSYSAWYGADTTGSYIGVQETDPLVEFSLSGGTSTYKMIGNMTSPSISLNGYADATLTFWTWWEIEGVNPSTGYDIMKVKISKDAGVTWTDLLTLNPGEDPDIASKISYIPYSSGGYNKAGAWTKHQLSLSSYVGSTVQIRFSFDSYDKKYNGFRGWFLDDVSISPDRITSSSISAYDIIKSAGGKFDAPRHR